jgi:predicted membrane protein
MIKINIIPQDKKREIANNKKIRIYFKFLNIFIINFLIYAFVFLTIRIIMQKYYNDTKNQTLIINQKTGDYSQEAKEINNQIEYIRNIQDSFVNWSNFFILLNNPSNFFDTIPIMNRDNFNFQIIFF